MGDDLSNCVIYGQLCIIGGHAFAACHGPQCPMIEKTVGKTAIRVYS